MATTEPVTVTEEQTIEEIPQWKLARQGIQLILNNKAAEAEALFKKYPNSIQMFAGYSFAVFMDALMTFEDDKLNLANATLKEMERRCATDTGWLKSMRTKMFGADVNLSAAQHLESQIILADSQVCMAILIFLQQDLSGYFKGGWVLRKSWKVYQHTYNEIRYLYKEIVGDLPDDVTFKPNSQTTIDDEEAGATSDSSCEWEFPDKPQSFSSTSPSNGYIQNKHPKMPHSYTTSFDTKQDFYNNVTNLPNNCFTCNCKCSCSISNNNSCSSSSNTVNNSCGSNCNAAAGNSAHSSLQIDCSYLSQNSSVDNENGYSNATSRDSLGSSISKSNNDKNSYASLSKINSVLKKSMSVSNALSKHSGKNKQPNGLLSQLSPFNSKLSISYLTSSFNIFSSDKQKVHDIDKETITRLLGAVSFGFGLFHLGISLLPPSLLRITNFLGFGGNRQLGVSNLMYARQGTDMRAPLATLSLLWYHTIVRPFYALDGSNVQAGVMAASQLLEESREEYRDSGLFLFFQGRVDRLNSDIPAALTAFQASVENTTQREIKVLSLHEVGWCHLIQLNYREAEQTFQILKLSSRWSRPFYAYLANICAGSCSHLKDFSNLSEMKSLFENAAKGSQLELFLLRRFKCCPMNEEDMLKVDTRFWKLFVYELLYLWNTLPSCATADIKGIIKDCESITSQVIDEPMLGISQLIQGSCYCILKNFENGTASFRRCLEIRKSKAPDAEDAHVSAFAQYELGTILLKNPLTKEEGKALLNQVAVYKCYDFEQRLTVRIHSTLKNI